VAQLLAVAARASGRGGWAPVAPLPAAKLHDEAAAGPSTPFFRELHPGGAARVVVAAASSRPAVTSELGERLMQMAPSARQPHVEAEVMSIVRDLGGAADLSADTPLMEAGIDSLGATEASTRIRELTGLRDVGPTFMFDHPSARAIASHVVD
jgi:hypothetical protein